MRPVLSCAMVLTLAIAVSTAGGQVCPSLRPAGMTIVMDFQGLHSERSVVEMRRELEGILKGSGIPLDWRTRREAEGALYANMVLVKFRGKCVMEPVGYLYDERGPLAFTHRADGVLLPFSEVACDQITRSIRPAMRGGDLGRGDVLLGRALGRVLAHEVVHILAQSPEHGRKGVAQRAVSGSQLIASELPLNPSDLERIFAADTDR